MSWVDYNSDDDVSKRRASWRRHDDSDSSDSAKKGLQKASRRAKTQVKAATSAVGMCHNSLFWTTLLHKSPTQYNIKWHAVDPLLSVLLNGGAVVTGNCLRQTQHRPLHLPLQGTSTLAMTMWRKRRSPPPAMLP